MAKTTQTPQAKVIHELQHAAQQYRIITSDEEVLQQTGQQIVRACKLQMSESAWFQNVALVCDHVRDWCEQRKANVALVLVDFRSDKTIFYIIPTSQQHDFQLGDEQADLDIFVNTRGAIGYAETRQIPSWEIDRFVSPQAYRVWPLD